MVSPSPVGRVPATPLQTVLRWCRGGLLGVTVFSAAANVLLLLALVYILQISNRGGAAECELCHADCPDRGRGLPAASVAGRLGPAQYRRVAGVGRVDEDAVAGAVPLGFAENGLRHADVLAAIVT